MKVRNILPVILAIAAFSSCSVYRSGQTPDDVYYSPAPAEEDSYLAVDNTKKGRSYGRYDNTDPDDNALRMKVRDRSGYRWNSFDSYNDWQYNGGYYGMYSPYSSYGYGSYGYGGYGYGGFGYGPGMGFGPYSYYNPWSFNSYWNSYYAWNSYYNPYCGGIIVGGKANPVVYNSVRSATNLSSYNNNRSYNNRNSTYSNGRPIYQSNNGRYSTGNGSYYNNPNSSGGLRRVYPSSSSSSGRSDSYQPSYQPAQPSAPVRSYSPSSSGGSSGGSGGGGGISRPSRGGR